MFDAIARRYRLVNAVMTLGLDGRWRRTTIRRLGLAPGTTVLDLASGTGELVRVLEAAGHLGVGCDLSFGMLAAGVADTARAVQADGSALPFADASFDGATSGFALRNFTDLDVVLHELARVVRPGGRLALLEVDTPDIPGLRQGHALWMRHVVPRLGALLSDATAYRYLPASLAYLPSPSSLAERLGSAGFVDVARHRLSVGVVQVVTATRLGATPLAARSHRGETECA